MSDLLRLLNDDGITQFRSFLDRAKSGSTESVPLFLFGDGATSDEFEPEVKLDRTAFSNQFEFGRVLGGLLGGLDPRAISRNHFLWTSLALYFFEELCPARADGSRNVLEESVYFLGPQFSFQKYYRHLVRTAWLAVREHDECAKVLLLTSGRGTRSEIGEQIGAYQELFANRRLIEATYRLYFDPAEQKLRRGAGGKGGGSPRRLASVVRQLSLTYDLEECSTEQLLALLPREFDRWKGQALTAGSQQAA